MHGRQTHEVEAFQSRLDRQAERTRHLRRPVYEKAGLDRARTILDIGSGSGAVTFDLAAWGAQVTAVDVDPAMTSRSRAGLPAGVHVVQADGLSLPFPDGHFDATVCNLTLMWCPDPVGLLQEMARVTRPDGIILASMEPDYGGKIHHPANPLVDMVFQGDAVRRRGGDPLAGRKLREQFCAAGLDVEVGISNASLPSPDEDLGNFRRNRGYYRRLLKEAGFDKADIDAWEEDFLRALEAGIELCFLPLFHAIGRHPQRLPARP